MIPDGITPVEGWRSWLIKGDGRLTSTTVNHVWDRGVSEARCLPTASMRNGDAVGWSILTKPHQSPHEDCLCGFYAMKELEHLHFHGSILGKVAMWGKVISGQRGYRAQYAKPIQLYVLTNPPTRPEWIDKQVKKLQELYDCPVDTMPRKKLEDQQGERLSASVQLFVQAMQSAAAATEDLASAFKSPPNPPTRWQRITLWLDDLALDAVDFFRGWFTGRRA